MREVTELSDEALEAFRLAVEVEDVQLALQLAAAGVVLSDEGPLELSSAGEVLQLSMEESTDVLRLGKLDRSPKSNWVEDSGGLPKYIEKIAFSLHTKRGFTISRAIATAVSMVKRWARGGENVNADTRAKSAAAVAQWTALKAKNKARGAAKRG